jgi:hypothetical protein
MQYNINKCNEYFGAWMDKFTGGLPLIFFVFMFVKCFKSFYFKLIFSNKYTDFKKRLWEKTKRLPKNSKGKTAAEWVYRQSEKRRRWALPAPATHPSPTCHQPLQYMEIGPPATHSYLTCKLRSPPIHSPPFPLLSQTPSRPHLVAAFIHAVWLLCLLLAISPRPHSLILHALLMS